MKRQQFHAVLQVPDIQGPLAATGKESFAVRTEANTGDSIPLAGERKYLLPGGQVPDADRPVTTSRGQVAAVAAESQARHDPLVPIQGVEFLPGPDFPNLDVRHSARGGQAFPVRA